MLCIPSVIGVASVKYIPLIGQILLSPQNKQAMGFACSNLCFLFLAKLFANLIVLVFRNVL
ncbi:hypothetical protein JHK87_028836 [Glycine soja]|nr:hypothetical protein JHK87_028836 [Glycine soja]